MLKFQSISFIHADTFILVTTWAVCVFNRKPKYCHNHLFTVRFWSLLRHHSGVVFSVLSNFCLFSQVCAQWSVSSPVLALKDGLLPLVKLSWAGFPSGISACPSWNPLFSLTLRWIGHEMCGAFLTFMCLHLSPALTLIWINCSKISLWHDSSFYVSVVFPSLRM